jgi:hypothetical protein
MSTTKSQNSTSSPQGIDEEKSTERGDVHSFPWEKSREFGVDISVVVYEDGKPRTSSWYGWSDHESSTATASRK